MEAVLGRTRKLTLRNDAVREFKGTWVFDDELPTSWPNWRSMGCDDRDGGKLCVGGHC